MFFNRLAIMTGVALLTSLCAPLKADPGAAQDTRGGNIGINGASCGFFTVASAIAAASSGDTIYIIPSTRTEFIGVVDKSLTFVPSTPGCAQELTTADSNDVIFDANGFSSNAEGGLMRVTNGATVTIRHMWLRDAIATRGGVIAVVEDSHLILDDALVTDGAVTEDGGNIYVASAAGENSRVTLINDSSVYRGTATNGGAIALANATLTMTDGNIGVSSNNGFSTASNDGGGIHAVDSTITMTTTQSQVIWNQAGRHGGGLYASDSSVTLSNTDVNNNQAVLSGGGIYLVDSTLMATAVLMDSNQATQFATNEGGGALFMSNGSAATLAASTISGNSSANLGGGIAVAQGATLDLSSGTVMSGNASPSSGGAINTVGVVGISDSTLSGNSSGRGGAINCFVCSEIQISNGSLIADNTADKAGGLDILATSAGAGTQVMIANSIFRNNVGTDSGDQLDSGGAIRMQGGSLTISDSVFDQNSAPVNGGALFAVDRNVAPLELVSMTNVAMTANTTTVSSTNQGGAGFFIDDAEQVMINDSLFENNQSDNIAGGGMILVSSDVIVSNSIFNLNSGSLGAGLYMVNNTQVQIEDTMLTNNVASNSGGGLYVLGGSLTLQGGMLDGNQALIGGGMTLNFLTMDIRNLQVSNNSATADGGGMSLRDVSGTVGTRFGQGVDQCDPQSLAADQYCSVISGNSAALDGGGIHVRDSSGGVSDLELSQLVLQANEAGDRGSALFAEAPNSAQVVLVNSLVVENGTVLEPSSTIEAIENVDLTLSSVTVAGNQGSPLQLNDTMVSATMNNSILHENVVGPQVSFGLTFIRGCNNSQNVNGSSQSMGGALGDPLFTTTARGHYRLAAGSPSRDACVEGPARDLDGLFRPDAQGLFDQGAFEMDGLIMLPDALFEDGFED